MEHSYSFPSRNTTDQRFGSPSRQHTCVRYVQQQNRPIDIPGRKRSHEIAMPGSPRSAGIGGYSTSYHKSGIGKNRTDDRNSGIGKLCYQEGGSILSESFSSMRRHSSLKNGDSFTGKQQRHRKSSQASVLSMPADVPSHDSRVSVEIEEEPDETRSLACRSTSHLPALKSAHEQQHSKEDLQGSVAHKEKHGLRRIWHF
ncbi:hypothetical protein COEREDRAFT_89900 [Coemansia reversa NRRL 1564]|uniref:Uncharacterized protein n=1 Tax=Coemansia reversa (strain ATCC 12441 / NRRL 1564) TaxID=763665 RepID=A0A2G5B1X7_COERN|nr:hypothetical protein COEREDRAFT_89900 [Coemansia reversa NRRL 1564]|eukprot:PIA13006.1 hypothetical protein COEREDRAFT_89900 [Coemansia reversa NRRL 1564]